MKRFLVIVCAMWIPVAVSSDARSWGSINDIRYKIKGSDGNLWESLIGGGRTIRGRERPNTLTFTFDDGPDHRTTPMILDVLDRYGTKAVFFVNAVKIHQRTAGGIENQAVLRDMYRRGHFIGSHTFSHQDITLLDESGWHREVRQAEQVIVSFIGRRPRLFRPPFGRTNEVTTGRLIKEGYTPVLWNLDSGDWKAGSAGEILANVKEIIEENPTGGVLLFHDTNRSTAEALPLIFEWIDERNDALSAAGRPPLEVVGIEHYIGGPFRKHR
jgi:peptidoglycan-N-acetylglucosamine deacetylase